MIKDPFRSMVRAEGVLRYRDLPWRRTRDPYGIWISEVMLQQTQVVRVETRWPAWLERFPSVDALAAAAPSDVLDEWQGMGYNRRALALHRAAQMVVDEFGGEFPREARELMRLPGVGPATAQGIRSFAFDLPGVYLETNVRTVFLHHFFPDIEAVPDKELVPLVEAACPAAPGVGAAGAVGAAACMGSNAMGAAGAVACTGSNATVEAGAFLDRAPAADPLGLTANAPVGGFAGDPGPYAEPEDADDTPRAWYYALLDYGAYLKKTLPNPSRRSSGYTRQSKFEGSRRQKRAHIVRMLLAARDSDPAGITLEEAVSGVNKLEAAAGREAVATDLIASILADLEREGFCTRTTDRWLSA